MEEDRNAPLWQKFHDNAQDTTIISTPIVTLIVGEDKREFYAHQGILVSSSPFFEGCLEGGMREATTKTVEFPEDDVMGHELLILWMYTSEVRDDYFGSDQDAFAGMLAWTLGDKFMIPAFQNQVLERIMDYWYACDDMDPAFFAWALENVPRTSQLYYAVKDMFIYHIATGRDKYKGNGKWQQEFAELLANHENAVEELFWRSMDLLSMEDPQCPIHDDYKVSEEQQRARLLSRLLRGD